MNGEKPDYRKVAWLCLGGWLNSVVMGLVGALVKRHGDNTGIFIGNMLMVVSAFGVVVLPIAVIYYFFKAREQR